MSLAARFKAALTAMRFPTAGTGGVNGDVGSFVGDNLIFPTWGNGIYTGSSIDYKGLIGPIEQSSLVMAAVNWLGRVLPEAPLQVYQLGSDGKEELIEDHPAALLWRMPNEFYTGSLMLKAFAFSWITDGNPMFLKIRNGGRKVVELWYVPPGKMIPRWPKDGTEFISHYEYKPDAIAYRIDPEDVLHFRDGFDPANARMGLSAVASLYREVYADSEVANYSGLLMRNGAVPPVVINLKEGQSTIGFKASEIKEQYQRSTQKDERGKAFVSNQPIEVTPLGFNPQQMDLKNLRRMPEERLSAAIGIPAIVLGFGSGLERSTFANTKQMQEYAVESYLVPLYCYIAEALTHRLLPEFEANTKKLKMAFDLSQVRALSEDQDALFKRLSVGYEGGWLKRSEAREGAGYDFAPEDEIYKTDIAPKVNPLMADPNQPEPPKQFEEMPPQKQLKAAVLMLSPAGVPLPAEIEASVDWWQAAVPDVAGELLDAEVDE